MSRRSEAFILLKEILNVKGNLLLVTVFLAVSLIVILAYLLSQSHHSVSSPLVIIRPLWSVSLEKAGQCGEFVHQGFEHFDINGNTLTFSALLNVYCNAEANRNMWATLEREGNKILVRVVFADSVATRCVCPFRVRGRLLSLPEGEYNFVLVFENRYTKSVQVLDSRIVVVGRQKGHGGMQSSVDGKSKGTESRRLWHYQLQNVDFNKLLSLDVAYIVVDPDDANFSSEQLDALRQSGKKVLAYLSIGEAEDYRAYWQDGWGPGDPDFIAEENPEWPGNYKVKFWDPRWREIVFERLRQILRNGYDGVYLDIVDAYEYWEKRGVKDAAELMVDFVCKISAEAKKENNNFLIVPQNAPELYAFEKYRACADGFGKEDIWYVDNNSQDPRETQEVLRYLDWAVRDGKFVLAIDYPTDPEKVCDFYRKCLEHNFYCTVSNRALDLPEPILCSLR